jgi:hypothetical protein
MLTAAREKERQQEQHLKVLARRCEGYDREGDSSNEDEWQPSRGNANGNANGHSNGSGNGQSNGSKKRRGSYNDGSSSSGDDSGDSDGNEQYR